MCMKRLFDHTVPYKQQTQVDGWFRFMTILSFKEHLAVYYKTNTE